MSMRARLSAIGLIVGGVWGMAGVAAAGTASARGDLSRSEAASMAPTRAQPRLLAETAGIQPGGSAVLAVTFEIDKGWHLYWTGRNDSGFAPRIRLRLPDGFEAEEPRWPSPKRYLQPGEILDHIYEERLTVLIPVRAPKSIRPGEMVNFTADLSWLVCEEMCIPESGSVKLALPVVGDTPGPAGHAALFEEARRSLPRPIEKDSGVEVKVSKGEAVFRVPGAGVLRFYPANECVPTPRLIDDGEARGEVLRVRLGPAEAEGVARVQGVLEVRKSEQGEPRYYTVDMEIPS